MENKMVLLITASILPQEKRFLKLRDPKKRLQQYLDSLKFYITQTKFSKIVLCDNSNYDFPSSNISALAKKYKKKVEILQFAGNTAKIAENGKGYGEGEIIEYALLHSKLLRNAEFFIKITGRLKVLNIDEIAKKMNVEKIYINKEIRNFQKNREQSKKMSTVLYGIPKKTYLSMFRDAYMDVCDKRGIYLEHIFYNRIMEKKITIYNMPRFPIIKGISGSLGSKYQASIGRERRVYDLLSRLQFYNCDLLRDSVTYLSQRWD